MRSEREIKTRISYLRRRVEACVSEDDFSGAGVYEGQIKQLKWVLAILN